MGYQNLFNTGMLCILTGSFLITSARTFVPYHKYDAQGCRKEAMTFKVTVPSLVACTYKCQSVGRCKTVQYDDDTQTCIGCTENCGKAGVGDINVYIGQCWRRDEYATDCLDHVTLFNATEDGVYEIKTKQGNGYNVYCMNRKEEGMGWTVFLRRLDETEPFNRSFQQYESGFGGKHGNHWQGLEFLHEMTSQTETDVLVVIVEAEEYSNETHIEVEGLSDFKVGTALEEYKLGIGQRLSFVHGKTACLRGAHGCVFSTYDRDWTDDSCPQKRGLGGWWYSKPDCGVFNPTGEYLPPLTEDETSMFCQTIKGKQSLKEITMAIRRRIP